MCIMCEMNKMGVTDGEIYAAKFFDTEIRNLTYIAASLAYKVSLHPVTFVLHRLQRLDLIRHSKEMAAKCDLIGISLEDFKAWVETDQYEFRKVLFEILTNLGLAFTLATQYLRPINEMDAAVEYAERRLLGLTAH